MRTGTVKFSMNQKVTDSLQTKKQEKTFLFMLQESTEELREGTELAMKKLRSSSYLSKKFILPTNV
jgi:hypothetical protein